MTDEELETLAKEIDSKLKQQVELMKNKEPMKTNTPYKHLLDTCEEKLMKNLKYKKDIALFNLYKEALINHLLSIRDYDCLKLYSTGLGISVFNDLEEDEKKKSE